jgi:hypothetical protein
VDFGHVPGFIVAKPLTKEIYPRTGLNPPPIPVRSNSGQRSQDQRHCASPPESATGPGLSTTGPPAFEQIDAQKREAKRFSSTDRGGTRALRQSFLEPFRAISVQGVLGTDPGNNKTIEPVGTFFASSVDV